MRCDIVKLRAARDRRAMTQEKLAAEAKIDIRTVQRAEAGSPLRQETIADIAAVLGLPLSGLIERLADVSEDERNVVTGGLTLKRARSSREIIELLEDSHLAKLECDTDPTDDIIANLVEVVNFIERLLPNPWVESGTGPLSFETLVSRLECLSGLNQMLAKLEARNLSLFIGSTWVNAVMPRHGDEGLYVRNGQRSDNVRATRLMISSGDTDRVMVQAKTKWPVEIVNLNVEFNDLDLEVPF